jgi:aspartate racemase
MPERKFVIGIYGGLGPAATDHLNLLITKHTDAQKDQDHPRRVEVYAPDTPDRTKAILGAGEDPTPIMVGVVKQLEQMGATHIGIPCNTAHAFIDAMQNQINIPIINMLEVTVDRIQNDFPETKRVGVLATTGTIKTEIYKNALESRQFEVVIPDEDVQEDQVMEGIYGKGGVKDLSQRTEKANALFVSAANHLAEKGAEVVIMGCTEIPIALENGEARVPLINPTEELAIALVNFRDK